MCVLFYPSLCHEVANLYDCYIRADSSPDSGIGAQLEDHTRISVNASDVPGLTSHRPIAPPKGKFFVQN